MGRLSSAAGRVALAAAVVALPNRALPGQEATPARVWRASVQANASIFFGNAEHRVVGSRMSLARADSSIEVGAELQALYGEAALSEGPREVTKRVWLATTSLDLRPFARVSPFFFGSAESNLEKRIATRYSAGAGAKYTFLRTDRTESSLSLALLDEHTVPRRVAAGPGASRLTRWSWRGRLRHSFNDQLRAAHVTFWQPSVRSIARYVVRSTTEIELKLTRVVGLTVSFVDSYDSEAVRRGARTYNDGQLLFGAMASW